MSSKIKIGERFDSINKLEDVMKDYVKGQGIRYWKRHSRTFERIFRNDMKKNKLTKEMAEKLSNESKEIKYKELSMCCSFGGRVHNSTSRGERPNRM